MGALFEASLPDFAVPANVLDAVVSVRGFLWERTLIVSVGPGAFALIASHMVDFGVEGCRAWEPEVRIAG